MKDESVRGYGPTVVDQKQNIRLNRVLFSNAVLSVDFSRPLKTDDAWSDHPLDGCHPWQVSSTNFKVNILLEQNLFNLVTNNLVTNSKTYSFKLHVWNFQFFPFLSALHDDGNREAYTGTSF